MAAAVTVVDREGVEALSMRKLGDELGVEAMSLYRYVDNKAALLDGVIESILGEMRLVEPSSRAWSERIKFRARALREALVRHPKALSLFATRPAVTTQTLVHLESALDVLREAGFSVTDAIRAFQSILALTVGNTLSVFSVLPSDERSSPAYAALSPSEFPRMCEAAKALARWDSNAEFEYGLDALVRGLEARLHETSTPTSTKTKTKTKTTPKSNAPKRRARAS